MRNTNHSFAHSIGWNLAGAGIPLAFAFFAIPSLLEGYGNERFGLLTIIWALIGYFSIFDFGIGRALTKLVSDRLGSKRTGDIHDVTKTALFTMAVLGVTACALLIATAPLLVEALRLDPALTHESILSLRILAMGIPFVILSAGLIGLLEAQAEFQAINRIRLLMGMLNFGAPLVMLTWSHSLVPATIALAAARAVTTALYLLISTRSGALDVSNGRFNRSNLRELLGFGSWITLSNLISPLMAQLDKVVIGSVVALHLLPFYAVPGDLINRLSFIPIALIGVFFPAFAAHCSARESDKLVSLYKSAAIVMFALVYPMALGIYALAPEGLSLWISEEFSQRSAPLLHWLCIGLIINSIARIPHALLQAAGRPSVTAKLHLIELPIYAVALWQLLAHFGIIGAAIAWTARMALDYLLLSATSALAIPESRRSSAIMLTTVVVGIVFMAATATIPSFWLRLALTASIGFAGIAWATPIVLRLRHNE